MTTAGNLVSFLENLKSEAKAAAALANWLRIPELFDDAQAPSLVRYLESVQAPEMVTAPELLAQLLPSAPIADQPGSVGQWPRTPRLPQPVSEIALVARELALGAEDWPAGSGWLHAAEKAPLAWRSALIGASLGPAAAESVIDSLLRQEAQALTWLGLACLINSKSIEQAGEWLGARNQPLTPGQLEILRRPEFAFLADAVLNHFRSKFNDNPLVAAGSLLIKASLSHGSGDIESAHAYYDRAWEAATDLQASAADGIAELALQFDQPLLALEASQHALKSSPSPYRQARAALSLGLTGNPAQGLSLLPDIDIAPQGAISQATCHLAQGDRDKAEEILSGITDAWLLSTPLSPYWLDRLIRGFDAIGSIERALQTRRVRIAWAPLQSEWHLDLAKALLAAGDGAQASQYAAIAALLCPEQHQARSILAQCYEASGNHAKALPQRRAIVRATGEGQLELAACALEVGDLETAGKSLEPLLLSAPDDSQVLSLHGRVLLQAGHHRAAFSALERATTASPDNASAWLALSQAHALVGDEAAALQILREACQTAPGSPQLHVALANALLAQDQAPEALGIIQHAIALDPNLPAAQVAKGQALLALGRPQDTIVALQSAVQAQPADFPIHLVLARAQELNGDAVSAARSISFVPSQLGPDSHFQVGRIQAKAASKLNDRHLAISALEHLQQADSRTKTQPEALRWLGEALLICDKAADAMDAFLAARQNAGENRGLAEAAILGWSRAASKVGDPSLAVSQLEAARSEFPESIAILIALSEAYQSAGLADQAAETAEMAVMQAPQDEPAQRRLMLAAENAARYDLAFQAARSLATLNDNDPYALLELSRIAALASDLPSARSALALALCFGRNQAEVLLTAASQATIRGETSRSLRLIRYARQHHPDDRAVVAAFAQASQDAAQMDVAAAEWEHLAGIDSDPLEAYLHAAQARWELGHTDAAIIAWTKASELAPDDAEIMASLARALARSGDVDKARKSFEKALRLDPANHRLSLAFGQAEMAWGQPHLALPHLGRAAQSTAAGHEEFAALGECLWLLGRPQESLAWLDRVIPLSPSAAVRSLQALALLKTGDLQASRAAFDAAAALPAQTKADVQWFARAASAHLAWPVGIKALAAWVEKDPDPELMAELLGLQLRALDAAQLLDAAADLDIQPQGTASRSQRQAIQSDLERFAPALEKDLRSQFALRLELHRQNATPEEWAAAEQKLAATASPENLECLAIHQISDDRPADAVRTLSAINTPASQSEWGPLLIGLAYQALGRYDLASQAFSAAITNPLLAPIGDYLHGKALLAQGNTVAAIQALNAAVAARPTQAGWHALLGKVYLQEDKADSALAHLQQAVELSPKNGELQLELARTLRRTGHLQGAQDAYGAAVRLMPSVGPVWKEAGEVALESGSPEQAGRWFERAAILAPSDPHCLIGAAKAAIQTGKLAHAEELISQAGRMAPEDPDVLAVAGDLASAAGDTGRALEAYDHAIAVSPSPHMLQLSRCRALMLAGRNAEAAESLQAMLETEKDDDLAWAELTLACQALSDTQGALHAAEKAVSLNPRNAEYRLNLASLNRRAGQLDRALNEALTAQSLAESHPRIALELGRIYEDRRQYKRALDSYQKAIELDHELAEAHFRAGLILKTLKAYDRAGEMLKRAADLNPRDPDTLHQLAAVRALELVHGGFAEMAVS